MRTAAFVFFNFSVVFLLGCGGSSSYPKSLSTSSGPAKLLIADDFDSGTFSPRWNAAYIRPEFYTGQERPFVEVDGRGHVMHYFVPAGSNEITPIQVGAQLADGFIPITGSDEIDELYFEWDEFFPTSEDLAVHAQKIFRVTIDTGGGERNGTEMNLLAQDHNRNLQLAFFHPAGPIDIFTNTNLAVPTGRWITFGVWARLNTPGESDGFGRVYIDGSQIVAMENISNRGDDFQGWNVLWVGGTFSNGAGNNSKRSSHRYIDNVRWYSSKP